MLVGTHTPEKSTLPSCVRGVGPAGGAGGLRAVGGGTPLDLSTVLLAAAEFGAFNVASRCSGSWLFSLQTYSVISKFGSSVVVRLITHGLVKTPGSSMMTCISIFP